MIGDKLQALLNERGIKPGTLATITGIPKSTIYSIIKRNNKNVDFSVMEKIADALGVYVEYFYDSPIKIEPAKDGELWEELQILRDNPETRALLKATKGMTAQDVRAMAEFAKALRKGKENDD